MFGRRTVAAGGLAAAAIAGWLGWSLLKAARALREAGDQVKAAGEVRFTVEPVDRRPPAGFELIGSPAVYRDATRYRGGLFLSGSGGLAEYDGDSVLRARFRTGMELPPAPLVQAAVGAAADSAEPELWIATDGAGLLAFNGRQFRQILPADEAARKLTCVLPLENGRILTGSASLGVLVYDGKQFAPLHPALSGLTVTALGGTAASLWIGTRDRGLFRFHAGQLDHFGEAEGLPDARVLSLAVSDDAAYAGTALGVAEFRDGRFRRVLAPGYLARSVSIRSGTLEVGTLEEGLIEAPLGAEPGRVREAIVRAQDAAAIARILELDGQVYALAGNGLYAADHGGLKPVLGQDAAMLTDRDVSALALDGSGKLWVGYFDRGLDILDPSGRVSHVENDHVFCVNRIAVNRERPVIAVGTANGLVMFDPSGRERQVLGHADGLIANQVTDVVFRPGGAMTVATPAGLSMIDTGGISSLYAFEGLVNNHVYALGVEGGRTMAGTLGGLSVLDGGAVTASFTTANSGLKHNWITAIARVSGDWFVGTYGAGVLRLDNTGRWERFADLGTGLVINPTAIAATDRAVYAGTLGKGLAVYSRATGRWTFAVDGLPSTNVTAVAARGGWVYIGTDNGLARAPEQELVR